MCMPTSQAGIHLSWKNGRIVRQVYGSEVFGASFGVLTGTLATRILCTLAAMCRFKLVYEIQSVPHQYHCSGLVQDFKKQLSQAKTCITTLPTMTATVCLGTHMKSHVVAMAHACGQREHVPVIAGIQETAAWNTNVVVRSVISQISATHQRQVEVPVLSVEDRAYAPVEYANVMREQTSAAIPDALHQGVPEMATVLIEDNVLAESVNALGLHMELTVNMMSVSHLEPCFLALWPSTTRALPSMYVSVMQQCHQSTLTGEDLDLGLEYLVTTGPSALWDLSGHGLTVSIGSVAPSCHIVHVGYS